jgi:peptidoglycan LD-endopeptidase CwlK
MDSITLNRIALLHPSIRDEVTTLVNKANEALTGRAQVRIVQGYRTFAEQNALFKKRPKVTNASGGKSIHNYGLAIDFALLIDGKEISWDVKKDFDNDNISDWLEVVKIFKDAGYTWGGDWAKFKDYPHLEKRGDWRNLIKKYNNKEFMEGTNYVTL